MNNSSVNYSKPYLRNVAGTAAISALGETTALAAADLSMLSIMAPQVSPAGAARDLYPMRAGSATVMKRVRAETEVTPVASGADFIANFTVATGLLAPITATGAPGIALSGFHMESTYTNSPHDASGNAYYSNPPGYATVQQNKTLGIPSGVFDITFSCTVTGIDSVDGRILAAGPDQDGSSNFNDVQYGARVSDTFQVTASFSRHVDNSENVDIYFEGKVLGVWQTIDTQSVTGTNLSKALSPNGLFACTALRLRMAGTASSNLVIEQLDLTSTGALLVGVTFPAPIIEAATYPADFNRVDEVSSHVRWNAMSCLVQVIGGADDAAVIQAAWSYDEPEIARAVYGELPGLARDYFASKRSEGVYAFWTPVADDVNFGEPNRRSANKLRVCVKSTTPNAIIRVVTESIFEFSTNNLYEMPMPYPAHRLSPLMRQEVWEAIARVPAIGENPTHPKKIVTAVSKFASGVEQTASALKWGAGVAAKLGSGVALLLA